MAQVLIADVTNKTEGTDGTGSFDVLMTSVDVHLLTQYNEGAITGAEYAQVYAGALQSVLQQAISFEMGKQAADKQAELLVSQINESNEKIDAIIAQTAQSYEAIKASQDKTIRENLLNNNMIAKIVEEIDLLQSKDSEEIANTVRKDTETSLRVIANNYDVAIKTQQELSLKEKNGLVVITYSYYSNGVDGTIVTTTTLANVVGSVLSTTITDGAGTSTTALDHEILRSKDNLIIAQTLGFVSDTKQKVLKLMQDGFAVAASLAGVSNYPEANQDEAIDNLTQELLSDVGSTVDIQSNVQAPATGE